MAIASLFGAIYVVWEYIQGYLCRKWPTTSGVIVHSKVETLTGNKKEKSPYIYYKYIVNDKEYYSRRLATHLTIPLSNEEADKLKEKYPLDKKVIVRFHPILHSFAVLETGPRQTFIHVFLFLILLLFFSISLTAILFPGYSPVFEIIMRLYE